MDVGGELQFKLVPISLLPVLSVHPIVPCFWAPWSRGGLLQGYLQDSSVCATSSGVHWACWKLAHSLIWHNVDMQATLWHLSTLLFSNFLNPVGFGGRGGALIAEPIHCTDRYPPGEWDASSTTHSYFPGVTLSGSLTWFEEMRIFLSFSLSLFLSLSFSCSFSFPYFFSGFCLYRQTGPRRRLDETTIEGRKSASLPLSLDKPWKQQSGCCCLPCSF